MPSNKVLMQLPFEPLYVLGCIRQRRNRHTHSRKKVTKRCRLQRTFCVLIRDDDEGSSEEGEEAMEQIGGNQSKVDKEEEEEDVDQLYQLDKYESDEESIGGG